MVGAKLREKLEISVLVVCSQSLLVVCGQSYWWCMVGATGGVSYVDGAYWWCWSSERTGC
ncbi:hypothetical protein P3S67_012570 [Capsicum chacoense]